MNTDQVADCADGKISEQGHRNTARQQRRRAPRGPIYLHTFKYFLTAPAQLQPCCTAVAGRRPWLAFRWQCQKTVSHGSTCKPATSAVMPLTIPVEFSLQFFPPCALFDSSWFQRLWNVIHQTRAILWNIYLLSRWEVSGCIVRSEVTKFCGWAGLINCQQLRTSFVSQSLCSK